MITFNNLKPDSELANQLAVAFIDVMCSGQYIGGDEVEQFEKEFAAYVGAKHCIAVGNGFDALQIALKIVGVKKGSKVAIPTNTCLPTWLAAHNVGADIIPVDPLGNHLISHADINYPVDVVIPVHLYGNPVSFENISRMKENSIVIEDACQAHGSYSDGHHAGTMGDMGCFSFYPTKNLGCYGDGGAIVTNNYRFAEQARRLRRYGEKDAINSCLDPLQAAFLRIKLKNLYGENERRLDMATYYRIKLEDCKQVTLPVYEYNKIYNYHQFVITVPRRDELKEWLKKNNIETMVHYHDLPYRTFPTPNNNKNSKMAYYLSNRVLSLPIANVTSSEIDIISRSIKEFYADKDM